MADNDTPKTSPQDAQEALQKQIAQMRREITSLKRTISAQTEEAAEDVSSWVNGASESAGRAATALKAQAQQVSGVVQANPATFSATALLFGAFGFLLGLAAAQSSQGHHRRWY